MQRNVLIGIGGTGARVIESMVHLCAVGLGPQEIRIILIDPDAANGNLSRTKKLVTDYQRLYDLFGSKFHYDAQKSQPFRTKLIFDKEWTVLKSRDSQLKMYLGYDDLKKDDSLRDLANLLFTEEELETHLNEGFRGHPSIGSVILASEAEADAPFRLVLENINGFAEGEVGVFTVGSIFGGTGAAGIPTLGNPKILKFKEGAKIQEGVSRIRLGTALVLPYFSFNEKTDSTDTKGNMYVKTSDFPIASKAALEYYDTKNLGYDEYFLIGDSAGQKQPVGEFSVGAGTQSNEAHMVEIFCSLSAFDFFDNLTANSGNKERQFYVSGRQSETVRWDDIPVTRNSNKLPEFKKRFRDRLSDFALFAFGFLNHGMLKIKEEGFISSETWFKENFKTSSRDSMENPSLEVHNEIFTKMSNFLLDHLIWLSQVSRDGVRIINTDALIHKQKIKEKKDGEELKLRDIIKDYKGDNPFGNYLFDISKNSKIYANYLAEFQNVNDVPKELNASQKYIQYFYNAANRFNSVVTNR